MLAFTFPGQGSQKEGMGKAWVDHPSWELVEEASSLSGRNLEYLLLDAPLEELTQTKNAQIATFLLSLVILDSIERLGLSATVALGHSLGEYTALAATGAISLEEGIELVALRGNLMQKAGEIHEGTMAAVLGLDVDSVEIACSRAIDDVWVANDNSANQIVIAGSKEGVLKASQIAKQLGAKKVIQLNVSGAFHTPFMSSAKDELIEKLQTIDFRSPSIPIISNVDATLHSDSEEWVNLLTAQLLNRVRWRQSIEKLNSLKVTTVIEVGQGGVLTAISKRVLGPFGIGSIGIGSPEDLDSLIEHLAGEGSSNIPAHLHGEALHVTDRIVISPFAGIFTPEKDLLSKVSSPATMTKRKGNGQSVKLDVGSKLGEVSDSDVCTPFSGYLQGFLTIPGERVTQGQPVAWIREALDI